MTHHISPAVTNFHRQIIIGTVFGGSSLVKPPKGRNCYLFMRSRNLDWMRFKAEALKIFANGSISQEKNSYRWHSNCYPLFCNLRNELYDNGKKCVTMDILNSMNRYAFMCWYGDCGRIINKRACLNTHKLGEKATEIISQFLDEVGYENEVVKERGYLRVLFKTDSTLTFLKDIVQVSPPCIDNKFELYV